MRDPFPSERLTMSFQSVPGALREPVPGPPVSAAGPAEAGQADAGPFSGGGGFRRRQRPWDGASIEKRDSEW